MNGEIKAYLRIEAAVAAAFNFFIAGMATALIYHKADAVPTNAVSIAIDLLITCVLTFTISAFFCRASIRRTKTAGILEPRSQLARRLSCLFRSPAAFGILLGLFSAVILFALIAPAFALLSIEALPFSLYMLLKPLSSMVLGGCVTVLELYAGMCKPN